MCQMNPRPVRGSVPLSAIRSRLPQPAMTRSGQAPASATTIASMISCAQCEVDIVTGAPGFESTMVPGRARICTGRIEPSFLGVSGSKRKAMAIATAERMLA